MAPATELQLGSGLWLGFLSQRVTNHVSSGRYGCESPTHTVTQQLSCCGTSISVHRTTAGDLGGLQFSFIPGEFQRVVCDTVCVPNDWEILATPVCAGLVPPLFHDKARC